jgi:trehalose 6-phosphate synthase
MDRKLIVVANRLPVSRSAEGSWEASHGGLVTAVTPILRERRGMWIGWSGTPDDSSRQFELNGINHVSVPLSSEEVDDFYFGFCNGTIWPLFHDAVRTPEFDVRWWRVYQELNERYAQAVKKEATGDDLIWVHDYHLLLVPGRLRRLVPEADVRFFLHIPFPPIEIFARLPWRKAILEGLLAADIVGFQTKASADNFKRSARVLLGSEVLRQSVVHNGRATKVLTAPISVDYEEFDRIGGLAETEQSATRLRNELGNPTKIIFGADRLDYTKGIDVRLRAYELLLEREPHLAETTRLIQIAVPSREALGDYAEMREEIEQLAGRINSIHGDRHKMPVHYSYESLDRDELVTYYRAADVMAVTPLVDGMNLVAKEYVTSRTDNRGVLLLSEFAGAARELTEAIIVNPYDITGMTDALWQALHLDPEDEQARMTRMRARLRHHDLTSWTRALLESRVEALAV